MPRTHPRRKLSLAEQFPPSEPCGCDVCLAYCARPGWWTVAEAARAAAAGLSARMMLEIAPERTFGVLAPAFKGCEGGFSLQKYAANGCGFLVQQRCELFGSGYQPLECRYCHHTRPNLGAACHAALEQDWISPAGRHLVAQWCKNRGLWELLGVYGLEKLKN